MIFQRADWLGVLQTVLFFVLQNSPESVCYYTACFVDLLWKSCQKRPVFYGWLCNISAENRPEMFRVLQ